MISQYCGDADGMNECVVVTDANGMQPTNHIMFFTQEDYIMKKRILALLLTVATGLTLAGCGSTAAGKTDAGSSSGSAAASDELTTVRTAVMTNNQSQWYAVIGDETGIFADHGIQVEITEFAAGINTVDAIVTQQADIGILADYAAVNRIGNTQDKSNLKFISRLATNDGIGNTQLYVDPKKIQSLEDLAGVGFVSLPGTVWDYWTAKTYDAANIPEDQRNVLQVDSAQSAVTVLTTGEGAAFWTSGANAQRLEEAGYKPLISLDDLNLHTDQYFISSTEYIKEHGEVVSEFLAASQDIAKWIDENPEKAAKIIETRTGQTADQFLADYEAIKLTIDFPQETVDHLNNIKDWAVSNGSFEDYTITDYVDLTALKNAVPDADTID